MNPRQPAHQAHPTCPATKEARRTTGRAQAAPARAAPGQRSGQQEATATGTSAGPDVRPATEWMKGAQTAHDLIVQEVGAGWCPDRIADSWAVALATYDDAEASQAQREFRAGARETAAGMIQTLRDIERAEAGQAPASRHGGTAQHGPTAPDGGRDMERQQDDWVAQLEQVSAEEDRQEQAALAAEDARFAALGERDQQAEAEKRGWSLASQNEPEPGAEPDASYAAEAGPAVTGQDSILTGTPQQAAELLTTLEGGYRAAYQTARQAEGTPSGGGRSRPRPKCTTTGRRPWTSPASAACASQANRCPSSPPALGGTASLKRSRAEMSPLKGKTPRTAVGLATGQVVRCREDSQNTGTDAHPPAPGGKARATAGEGKDRAGMKQPPGHDPSPAPVTRGPEYVVEAWDSEQLKDKIRRLDATPASSRQARHERAPEPDREAEP
jgi:hypothetical protein